MLPRACLRVARALPFRAASSVARSSPASLRSTPRAACPGPRPRPLCAGTRVPMRTYASASAQSPADLIIEEITEQYATAKDEFEIAVEETEKNTVYAPDDRAAAGEEMAKLRAMYDAALAEQTAEVAAEIKRRIGQRIRELDEAIKGLKESAKHAD